MASGSVMTPGRWGAIVVIPAAVVTVLLLGAGMGGLWFARFIFDSQWTLTLRDVMKSEPDAADPTTDVRETTSSECTPQLPCVEAYDTAEATYLRFNSREDAARHAAAIEDGFLSNYIVMDFAGKDAASKTHQLWAMQHLAGTWQDYQGGFPAR